MTYFPDLSQYAYLDTDREMLNIGWLDGDHLYPTGPVADGLVDGLLKLMASPQHQTRDRHGCDLCGDFGFEIDNPYAADGTSWPGSAEIHVEGAEGVCYAAPTMIHHYIVEHEYCPPEDFQQAVLAAA